MSYKKEYGYSRNEVCPFCSRMATQKNEQGVAVCHFHLREKVQDRKCDCGKWLEFRTGKYGPYFNCPNCGNFSVEKGMRRGSQEKIKEKPQLRSSLYEENEIVITSRDAEYFD